MRACLDKDMDAIRRLVEFFRVQYPRFIDLREPRTLNSALHVCASNGYFVNLKPSSKVFFYQNLFLILFSKHILLYLLERHADVNIKNKDGNTPLFSAASAFQRDCAKVVSCFFKFYIECFEGSILNVNFFIVALVGVRSRYKYKELEKQYNFNSTVGN